MEPVPWIYVGAGAGLAMVVWSAIRPQWSWRRLLRHAIGALIAGGLFVIVLACLNPQNGLGPYAGSCVANLRAIHNAKSEWARQSRKTGEDAPQDSDLFGASKFVPSKPVCPEGGTYRLGAVDEMPDCSLAGPQHFLQNPPRKHFEDDASARAFFVVCGLAFVAFLQTLRGAGQATLHSDQSGQVLVLSALALILALGVLLALPNFVKARANSPRNACMANLKQIEGAKATWAMETPRNGRTIPACFPCWTARTSAARPTTWDLLGGCQFRQRPAVGSSAQPEGHLSPGQGPFRDDDCRQAGQTITPPNLHQSDCLTCTIAEAVTIFRMDVAATYNIRWFYRILSP